MAATSTATTVWQGDLMDGRGATTAASGVLSEVEVSWAARTERTPDTTSPEELLAAAHASCFCMALSKALADGGNEPERLEATAAVSFVPGEGVTASRIEVKGRVPGIDGSAFDAAVQDAKENCPISQALRGNVELSAEATLEN